MIESAAEWLTAADKPFQSKRTSNAGIILVYQIVKLLANEKFGLSVVIY